jgi:hypothetical protein
VIILIIAQLLLSVGFLLMPNPKPAKAFWGVGDLTIMVGDIPENIWRILDAALARIAINYANKYLTRFIEKVIDKYKIRSYLYYDQVLTNYYLSHFIADKIGDPDLRQIYVLLEKTYITGQPTGYSGGPAANQALIPQLKKKIYDVYLARGGIPSDYITNPPAGTSGFDYYNNSFSYYLNHPSFAESNALAQYDSIKAASSTASMLEVITGKGLKSGRNTSGACDLASAPRQDVYGSAGGTADPLATQEACESLGGTWSAAAAALGQVATFINNPADFIDSHIEAALNDVFNVKADPNNVFTAIGTFLGNYIFKKLDLDQGTGTLNEYPSNYRPEGGTFPPFKEFDIDGDGIMDAEDTNRSGAYDAGDSCYHGGVAPNCMTSNNVGTSPYFTQLCQAFARSKITLQYFLDFMNANKDQFDSNGVDFNNPANANIWVNRSVMANGSIGDLINTIETYDNRDWDNAEAALGQYSKYMDDVVDSLIQDQDLDLALFGTGGGGIDNLIQNTQNILDYIRAVEISINKCNDPDPSGIPAIPPPVITAPPNGGGGGTGGSCTLSGPATGAAPATVPFDLNSATLLSSTDVKSWPETTTLDVNMTATDVIFNFDKRDGASRWPDEFGDPEFAPDPIQYTMWLFLNINGQWNGAGVLVRYFDQNNSGNNIFDWICNEYYDAGRWAPMTGHKIAHGEEIGFMVTSGDARSPILYEELQERSNVFLVNAP